ncbi:hypothetical protein EV421DRAFT_1900062 [Armillaria borealis]|uniref:CxC2-like cysteine cluster KDZ transposase-associated domain-containing protein n=1 Tax=Armillaria borealis TaxID=47425 RepID=A0AA39JWZ8_9AGAR|nr:hypothetical protein EV421DRAFT_1900062 [Armillaria borealis]
MLCEQREEGATWETAGNVEGDAEVGDEDYLEAFNMSGWKQYAPVFAMDASGELVEDLDPMTEKRKRYDSSDDLMHVWFPLRQDFLNGLLQREEFGDHTLHPRCTTCKAWLSSHAPSSTDIEIVTHHACTPLHVLMRWNGSFWEDTSLKEMGLIYQLGHSGADCPIPGISQTLTILHVNGVHMVNGHWCACDISHGEGQYRQLLHNGWYPAMTVSPRSYATFECLDTFRLLNVVANMNIHDYVSTLEQKVDAWGTEWVADRYKAFGRMSQQWAYLKRLKRAGVGHLKGGLTTAELGSVAIQCWVCPRDGVNLPSRWRDTTPSLQYLHCLLVGMDANFHLKNRLRMRNKNKSYVNEKDISTCIAFAALMQKDTCLSMGLRCTGVGGCICIRHKLVRPLGLGDLLKGERYANMDYIFWSSVQSACVKNITLLYDVGCQYKINMEKRCKKLPALLHRDSGLPFVDVTLPVWHGDVHVVKCKTENSLMYQDSVGKSDGEGVERTWLAFNPMDCMDRHNFRKNVGLGESLVQRLKIALVEQLKIEWRKKIDKWCKDRLKLSPYAAQETSARMTEAQVRLQLQTEELQEVMNASTKSIKKISITAFLIIGSGARKCSVCGSLRSFGPFPTVWGKVHELRISFFKKLSSFCKIQAVHMPGMVPLIEEEDAKHDSDNTAPSMEDIKLWLPSQIPEDVCPGVCEASISNAEFKLQARAAMVALRGEDSCREFKKLEAKDIAPVHEVERDAKASKCLGRIGGRDGRAQARPMVQKLMWIWTALGGPRAEVDEGVHKCVQVEWSKVYARKLWWCEEVEILHEEMQRSLRSLKYKAGQWEERAQQDDTFIAEEDMACLRSQVAYEG